MSVSRLHICMLHAFMCCAVCVHISLCVCMRMSVCSFMYLLAYSVFVCAYPCLCLQHTMKGGREGERERESETETGSYVDWQVEALVSFCKHRGAVYISMILQWQVYVCKLHSVPTATYMPTSMHTSKQLCNAPYIDRLIDA